MRAGPYLFHLFPLNNTEPGPAKQSIKRRRSTVQQDPPGPDPLSTGAQSGAVGNSEILIGGTNVRECACKGYTGDPLYRARTKREEKCKRPRKKKEGQGRSLLIVIYRALENKEPRGEKGGIGTQRESQRESHSLSLPLYSALYKSKRVHNNIASVYCARERARVTVESRYAIPPPSVAARYRTSERRIFHITGTHPRVFN